MIAYKMRHRVDIEELIVSIDSDDGAQTESWEKLEKNVPASINPLSGRELIAANAVQSSINTRIVIRYREDLKPSMRVINQNIIYNIKAIIPDPTLRHHITLMCESGLNDG
jgi:SPP1 family predicted phage head-tail adaptor